MSSFTRYWVCSEPEQHEMSTTNGKPERCPVMVNGQPCPGILIEKNLGFYRDPKKSKPDTKPNKPSQAKPTKGTAAKW